MLKNRSTNEPLFVVIFTLLPKEKMGEESSDEGNEEYASANEDELD